MKKIFTVAMLAAPTLIPLACTTAAAQETSSNVVYLDQAWSQADREMYYQTSQGSRLIAYDIFLNLEVADGQELFRSDANSERYGLIPQAPNPRTNSDGLPVGLTKTVFTEGRWKGETVGVTCALCHTGELTYKGKHIRIDGGIASRFDFMAYAYALDNAVQATLTDAAKFDRLATRLGLSSPAAKTELRERFASDAERLHFYCTRTMVAPVPWGPGRIDAGALIVDRVVSVLPDIPENWSTPVAPTKPPFLWNSSQGLWTQWSAVTQDPIFRNVGETLGVFMSIDLTSKTPEQGLFEFEQSNPPSQGDRGSALALGASQMARRCAGPDRPREGSQGQGAVRHPLRGLPQCLALHMDGAEQVRQALHRSWTGAARLCRHRVAIEIHQAVRDHRSAGRPIAAAVSG